MKSTFPMRIKEIYNQFFLWRDSHIKERHFLLFVCFLVGILTAVAAWLLKAAIHFFQVFLTENFSQSNMNFAYLLFPIVGILLAGLYVRYIVKDDISTASQRFSSPSRNAKAVSSNTTCIHHW